MLGVKTMGKVSSVITEVAELTPTLLYLEKGAAAITITVQSLLLR